MNRTECSCKLPLNLLGLLWAWVLCALPAGASVMTMEVERLDTPIASMNGLVIELSWPDDASQGLLSLSAKRLDAGEFGYRWQNLRWSCELKQVSESWQCSGPIRAKSASGLTLSAHMDEGGIVVEAQDGPGRARVDHRYDPAEALRMDLVRVPAAWLAPLLSKVWEDGRLTSGSIDMNWQIRIADDEVAFSGPVSVSGFGLDSKGGSIAAEGLAASGQVHGKLTDEATAVELDVQLKGGEVLVGPVYVPLPDSPVTLAMNVLSIAPEQWRVDALRWQDPGVLDVQGAVRVDLRAESVLRDADMHFSSPALTTAHARYLDSLAASFGLSGLTIQGAADGSVVLRNADWQSVDLSFKQVDLKDGQGRFSATGLSGKLGLRYAESLVDSELSWQSGQVYGLSVGAATLPLRSVRGGLSLRAPVAIPLFGGFLRIKAMDYAPDNENTRLDLAVGLDQVELGPLSAAFDWPDFSGSISGELPSVHYADDRLEFEGGLSAQVFDGQMSVSQLSMERPFGVAPMLAASIDFSNLDLEPLTGAFDFGEISGRLDGHVRGLRLVDWEPVAFDAAFHTVKRSGVRRRISQRAVRDLTEVGGGGIAAGLQAQVLKAFASFGYEHIGLSCVLSNNVCTMGGVGPATGGGYTIVEGSGLPRVSVIGHQKRVDWPVLLARLKAATEGQAPLIQ